MPPPPPTDENGNVLPPPTDENGNMMQPPFDPNNGSMLNIAEGYEVSIKDANGKTVYSVTAKRSASFVMLSSPELAKGETYSLVVNGAEIATAQAATEAQSPGGSGWGNPPAPSGDGANGVENTAAPTAAPTEAEVSKNDGASGSSAKTIMLVLGAAALVAIACVATIITVNARNRKKRGSTERESGEDQQ